ncbi:hypothetical protein B5M44_24105 [Shinella sumterensis]|uniref:hypothetical protein n=1 Tax=Shinella sumterensis TaxID=1967501 RepID=UPI00106ED744|nr:hypothetical protein [Shinella sumterensis]MCD1264555.1 hypothetical protein [Shinella sumterensis]TFE94106.1 hypothetical protein B5M44_24105 [Shinella sumterensis]
MADFDPPFAWDGERRVPTADEIQSGIGCGPFSLPLWNWLLWSLQSEIGHVITFNGLTPDNGDMEQLRKAIQAQIDASTGGGDPSTYLTLLQASSRLPIFPEVQNANGHFGVITPATGQVRVPAGVNFLHRGISPYATVQTDLATDASKTYHLRWNKTDGFSLKDLSSGAYNPSTLAEANAAFDSSFDDMLVARVVTNSSNVPTITNLVNKDRMAMQALITGTNGRDVGQNGARFDFDQAINWARTPKDFNFSLATIGANNINTFVPDFSIGAKTTGTPAPTAFDVNRYRLSQTVMYDYSNALVMQFAARA